MAQACVKGNIALSIDRAELEARFDFSPDQSGEEWSAERLVKIALDSKITGLNQKRAEEIIGKFSRAKGLVSEIIATGQAPEQPQPENVEWADLPVPPELAGLAEKILSGSGDPELYKVKTEIIRVEKIVEKPAALPFLPPRQEKVVSSEKKETRERVFPNADIIKTGFASAGQRIGISAPPKPGKAGKSIFGKPIQPISDDMNFILGRGVTRAKNELLAEYDGILRAGLLWAEILPCAPHRFSVSRSAEGLSFLLDYLPGHPELPAPDAAAVIAEALKLGAPEDSLVPRVELEGAMRSAREQGRSLSGYSLSMSRDAAVELRISPDRLRASLFVTKGRGGGKPLDLAEVSAALKAANLKGLKGEALKKDVLAFYKSPEDELIDYVLVEGQAPARGKDRVFMPTVAFLPDAKAKAIQENLAQNPGVASAVPSLAEFPLEEASQLALVGMGQKIGELSPVQPGQPGRNVHGEPIPAIPGNDPVIKTFEGLVYAKGAVVAQTAGLLMASEADGVWKMRLIPYRDSSVEIQISPDGMEALVSLRAEEGLGKPLAVETVLGALRENGVVSGLDSKAVAEAVAAARAGEPVLKRLVASGKPPVAAGGLKLSWLVKLASGSAVSIGADGRADFRSQDKITKVSAGEPVLRIEKGGGAGESGRTVLGAEISAASNGAELGPPIHDDSIREETSPDGATVFVAAVSGELIVEKSKLWIRERLAVKGDVGPSTGNLRFPGAVSVSGSVLTGFQLFSSGDIHVAGSVEAALVSAEGSVIVVEGVKGHKKGTLRAKRRIEAGFAEQALLLAVEDIRIKSACILCNVKTNGRLVIAGDRGALIGGLVRARGGIDVASLGSENGIKTEVSFGQDYLLADMIETEEREIEKVKAAILQADRAMAELERAGAGLDGIRQDKLKLMKLLEKRTLRIFDFREKFEVHAASEIRVRGTVFPGVILESHNRFFEVKSRRSAVAFVFDPGLGRIVEKPLKK